MLYQELTEQILDAYYDVRNQLKTGFPEVFYQRALAIALDRRGVPHEREVPTPVTYRGHSLGDLRLDFVVDRKVIVECKRAPRLLADHRNQVIGYLHATPYQVALLLNFGEMREHRRLVYTQ